MEVIWLNKLQKHSQCQQVIARFSLPNQVKDFLLYLEFVFSTGLPELRP
jgi:hypothetical protein